MNKFFPAILYLKSNILFIDSKFVINHYRLPTIANFSSSPRAALKAEAASAAIIYKKGYVTQTTIQGMGIMNMYK